MKTRSSIGKKRRLAWHRLERCIDVACEANRKRAWSKCKRPEVENRFRNDVDTMIFFLRLFQPQHVPPLKEVQRNFLNEFDYRIEAENLREMKRLIEEGKFSDRVKIPEPKVEMCSKNALFMEEIEGVPLVRGVKESYERFLKATGKSADANAMRHSANALLADEAKNETNFKDVEETASSEEGERDDSSEISSHR